MAHHRDSRMVLGRTAQHGRPSYINVLNRFFARHARARHGLLERVKIHHDEIDRREAVRFGLPHVFRQIAAEEQSAVDEGVQRLDATVEHLGKSGVLGDVFHGQSRFPQSSRSAAGGQQLDAVRGKPARQFDEAGFVGDGKKGAPDLHAVTASARSGTWWNCIS